MLTVTTGALFNASLGLFAGEFDKMLLARLSVLIDSAVFAFFDNDTGLFVCNIFEWTPTFGDVLCAVVGGIFSIDIEDGFAGDLFNAFDWVFVETNTSGIELLLTVRGITDIDGGSAAFTEFGINLTAFVFLELKIFGFVLFIDVLLFDVDNWGRDNEIGVGDFDCGLAVRLIAVKTFGTALIVAAVDARFIISIGTRFDVTVKALLLFIWFTALFAASLFKATVLAFGFLIIVGIGCALDLFCWICDVFFDSALTMLEKKSENW